MIRVAATASRDWSVADAMQDFTVPDVHMVVGLFIYYAIIAKPVG